MCKWVECVLFLGHYLGGWTMRCVGWCWRCYEGLRGRRFYRGHFGPGPSIAVTSEDVDMMIRRGLASSTGPGGGGAYPAGESLAGDLPGLLEFLCVEQWDPQTPRTTGTVLIFVEAGQLKACLSDRDAAMVTFCTAPDLLSLLQVCNGVVLGGAADWRRTKQSSTTARRRS